MIVVIGDAHGCIEQINNLMDKIGPTSSDRVISIGDFVDRGPDSPACVEFAMKHESIMGNHEYKHVRYHRGVLKKLSPSQIGAKMQFEKMGKDYVAAIEFMATLPFYIDLPEATLVHAGLDFGKPMTEQDRIVLIGGMSQRRLCGIDPETNLPYWCASYPNDTKPVVFGHLSIDKVAISKRENLFAIDTGCCAGGELTAVTIPNFKIYSVPGWKRPRLY